MNDVPKKFENANDVHHAVIGINFGDEGKGHITNYLCKKYKDSGKTVVNRRFNGGAQAGHTVYNDGKYSVHHMIPSGVKYADYIGYEDSIIFNPVEFMKEITKHETQYDKEIKIEPNSTINFRITTIYDILANRSDEENLKNGSCGLGIFKTFKRHEQNGVEYDGDDVKYYEMVEKYYDTYTSLDVDTINEDDDKYFFSFLESMYRTKQRFSKFNNELSNKVIVFEGAQGVGLDQFYLEYYPHLTPSRTGSKSLHVKYDNLTTTYVSRIYQTRHGADSKFKDNSYVHEFFDIVDPTNYPNEYQGAMKFDFFSFATLKKHLQYDMVRGEKYQFALTCVDQLKDQNDIIYYAENGDFVKATYSDFIDRLKTDLTMFGFEKLLISNGIEVSDIEDIEL